MKYTTILATSVLSLACIHQATALTAVLALRYEANGIALHGGVANQTIESSFGSNSLGLAFTGGTQTYDFYSSPLSSAAHLANNDKAGGIIYMKNTAPAATNDFSVSSSMVFYDYDPHTGIDSLIIQTRQTSAAAQKVNHGATAHWNVLQSPARTNYTIAAGHMLHIAVVIHLESGDPGSFGQLVFNGPVGQSSVAWYPRNSALPLQGYSPAIAIVAAPPCIDSLTVLQDKTVQLDCTCDAPGYYWTQASTNLCDPSCWVTLGTNLVDSTGLLQFVDTDAPNYSCRFYRVVAH